MADVRVRTRPIIVSGHGHHGGPIGGPPPPPTSTAGTPFSWHGLVQGGGYVSQLSYSSDGRTMLARTDSAGGYIWNFGTGRWDQLATSARLGTTAPGCYPSAGGGVYDLQVAPSDSRYIYMTWGNIASEAGFNPPPNLVWHSSNRGSSFAQTDHAQFAIPQSANTFWRNFGPKGAVDPANPLVYFQMTQTSGLYVTKDGGVTFTQISTGSVPPNNDTNGGGFVIFDPSSPVSSGFTQGLYVGSNNNGVYHSVDGGTTWTSITASSGPTSIVCGGWNPFDNFLWAADGNTPSNVWRYTPGSPGTWNNMVQPNALTHGFTFKSSGTLWIMMDSGNSQYTADNGATWTAQALPMPTAGDTPWLAATLHSSNGPIFASNLIANPNVPGEYWLGSGLGVWKTNSMSTGTGAVTYTAMSNGIENLSGCGLVHPTSGAVLTVSQDQGLIPVPTPGIIPTTRKPSVAQDGVQLEDGWDVDWAPSNPLFTVQCINLHNDWTGYSTDGGNTITSLGQGGFGGMITACSSSNILFVAGNNQSLTQSMNGGATFSQVDLSSNGVAYFNSMTVATPSSVGSTSIAVTSVAPQLSNLVTFGYTTMRLASTAGGFTDLGVSVSGISGSTISLSGGIHSALSSGNTIFSYNGNYGWTVGTFSEISRHTLTPDYVQSNVMYAYNMGNTNEPWKGAGVYRWSSGAGWTQQFSGFLPQPNTGTNYSVNNAILKAVPMLGTTNTSSHLFFTPQKPQGGSFTTPNPPVDFVRSLDGGVTWNSVSGNSSGAGSGNVQGVWSFGFGACAPGQGYPAVFIIGYVKVAGNYQFGVYRSDDNCNNWNQISLLPQDWYMTPCAIDGDKNTYGKCYVARFGAGFTYFG